MKPDNLVPGEEATEHVTFCSIVAGEEDEEDRLSKLGRTPQFTLGGTAGKMRLGAEQDQLRLGLLPAAWLLLGSELSSVEGLFSELAASKS